MSVAISLLQHDTRFSVALSVLALCGAVFGCGEPGETTPDEPEPTGFELALEEVGEGILPSGTGFGWIDLAANRPSSRTATALGPDSVADPGFRGLDAFGIEPGDSDSITSLVASYTLGVRLDEVPTQRLSRSLDAAGADAERSDGWMLYDHPGFAVPYPSPPLSHLGALGSRIAIRGDSVVLARVDTARRALLGRGESPISRDPMLALAAECLGEVESARTQPANFTHNAEASPDLLAVGVSAGAGPPAEVLCAIGTSVARADEQAEALRESFAAGAKDRVTRRPIADSVGDVEVDQLSGDGVYAARARLELAAGEPPGFLYGAIFRGSLLTFVGAPVPIPGGVGED